MSLLDRERVRDIVRRGAAPAYRGRIDVVSGVMVEAAGVPAAMGELCRIERGPGDAVEAEVVGFRGDRTLLMPHGDLVGISPGQSVYALGREFGIEVSDAVLGRMLDGFGNPIDESSAPLGGTSRPVRQPAPLPMTRRAVDLPITTGVRAIDGLNTLGLGQRVGIFAGPGVGKSTLLGEITASTDADVVVACLVGERGREVRDFATETIGDAVRQRTVLVAATSDRSPLERLTAPFTAITIAEHFRDAGKNVLVVVDSVTRFAHASREIGLAAGEPPATRGFPPSFFATMPKLLERMGRTRNGSITGLLTVLVDGEDDDDPVADTLRGMLDGHIVLSRDLAQAGHFPAIDVLKSLSRLMPKLITNEHAEAARTLRGLMAAYGEGKDLVDVGAYVAGSNAALDAALERMPAILAFLRQGGNDATTLDATVQLLRLVAGTAANPEMTT